MNDDVGDVHGLVLCVGVSVDVDELKNFFDGGKYGRNWVSRMICGLLEDFLVLEYFLRYKLIIVFLEVSEHVSHGGIDGFCCAIVDICKILLLDCSNNLFHEGLLDLHHFSKKTHFLVVCDSHV